MWWGIGTLPQLFQAHFENKLLAASCWHLWRWSRVCCISLPENRNSLGRTAQGFSAQSLCATLLLPTYTATSIFLLCNSTYNLKANLWSCHGSRNIHSFCKWDFLPMAARESFSVLVCQGPSFFCKVFLEMCPIRTQDLPSILKCSWALCHGSRTAGDPGPTIQQIKGNIAQKRTGKSVPLNMVWVLQVSWVGLQRSLWVLSH